ncbi:MAG: TetR family transcriptional regulator [Pseudonocardiales bacterium]|nr:MAG: TetR family transcriptional regulator [Pseudonocardiales bacterium]
MTARDPLFDTLFRSTTIAPSIASAAPVRAAGTRSRAGNAMNRTRAALLDGARLSVEASGTKITMAQVAAAAGVAKATLYNHFRTREAVLSALLSAEVSKLVDSVAGQPLATALAGAADALSRHPSVRTLGRIEPATLAALGCIDVTAESWHSAREAVRSALRAENRGGTDTVLRWLASYLITPGSPTSIAADLCVVLAGLPAASPEDAAEPAGPASRTAQPA